MVCVSIVFYVRIVFGVCGVVCESDMCVVCVTSVVCVTNVACVYIVGSVSSVGCVWYGCCVRLGSVVIVCTLLCQRRVSRRST